MRFRAATEDKRGHLLATHKDFREEYLLNDV